MVVVELVLSMMMVAEAEEEKYYHQLVMFGNRPSLEQANDVEMVMDLDDYLKA
jgi:hypothetical protein